MSIGATAGRLARTVGRSCVLALALGLVAASAGAAGPPAAASARPAANAAAAGRPAATRPTTRAAAASDGELDADGGVPSGRLQADPLYTIYANDCRLASFWKAQAERAAQAEADEKQETTCYDQLSVAATRQSLIEAANQYIAAARAYFSRHPDAVAPDACSGAALPSDDAEQKASSDEKKAKDALDAANKTLADKNSAAEIAKYEDELQSQRVTLLGAKATPEDIQKAVAARSQWNAAKAAVAAAEKDVEVRKKALDDAKQKVADAGSEADAAADAAIGPASAALLAAVETAQGRQRRSPDDFEKHVDDPAWVKACADLRRRAVAAGVLSTGDDEAQSREAKSAAEDAREKDILRKAPSIPSVVGSGGGYLETGGAPDHVTYTLFSALGADQKTTGTQVLMTLNIGQLVPGAAAPDRPAWLRNLFVRAGVPLTATKDQPVAGGDGSGAENNVSRMSFVLGTSLSDSTDPRVPENRPCYLSALSYVPFDLGDTGEESPSATQGERGLYYDVCNRRAANRQRLALRLGLGLLIDNDDASTTRPEYMSGAMVWAPSSWLYVNLLYQRLFLPFERHSFGGGISTAFNTPSGPAGSGVDSWARIGADVLVLGTYDDVSRATDIEARLQLTARFKLPASGIVTLGLGPRVLGSALQDPGVLASVGLTYDADALLEPLLSGPPAPATASK